MIDICFFYSQSKIIIGFRIYGHSGLFSRLVYKIKKVLSKDKAINSKDYICSAVSAVSYMTIIGLTEICGKKVIYKINDSGFMECFLKEEPDRNSIILMESLKETLNRIDREYPGHMKFHMEDR